MPDRAMGGEDDVFRLQGAADTHRYRYLTDLGVDYARDGSLVEFMGHPFLKAAD